METVASRMTIEHLGQDATEDDLRAFRLAVSYSADDEQTASDYYWNNGDWVPRVAIAVDVCIDCGRWIFPGESHARPA